MTQYPDDIIAEMARAACAAFGDDYDEQPENLAALRAQRRREGGSENIGPYDPGLPTREDWRVIARACWAVVSKHQGWRPIETAPQYEHGKAVTPFWVACPGTMRLVFRRDDGTFRDFFENFDVSIYFRPTVWMPIPNAPPSSAEEEG